MNGNSSSSFLSPFSSSLSTIVFIVLLLIFIGALVYVGYATIKAYFPIKRLLDEIKDEATHTIAKNRSQITKEAKGKNDSVSHQWLEFNKTLVEVKDREKERTILYNTLDAAHFFNATTIGGGLSGNRLLAAVPGVLTAIGVIGTFVGLQLSLSNLQITGEGVGIEEMKQGVSGVIDGAKIAFVTSLYGIFSSVIFNIIEKAIEQYLRKNISQLQTRIDELFPRLSIEGKLQDIAESSKGSQKILQELAEEIGKRMQKSIEGAMTNAIEKLIENTQTNNSATLENLLQGQRQAMEKTTKDLNASMAKTTDILSKSAKFQAVQTKQINEVFGNMGEGLQRFTQGLDEQSKLRDTALTNSLEKQKAATEALVSDSLEKISGTLNKQSETLNNFIADLRQQSDTSSQRESQRNAELNTIFTQQNAAVSEKTDELMTKFAGAVNGIEVLLKQGMELQHLVGQSEEKQQQIIQGMENAASQLTESAEHIRTSGETLANASGNLQQSVTQATETTNTLSQENQATAKRLEEYREGLHNDLQQFVDSGDNVNETMQAMLKSADTTLETLKQHQDDFLNGLHSRVDELNKAMEKSLQDYAEQANDQTAEHLKVWTQSVTDYSTKMNNAVQALAGVVDEIEGKIGD